MREDFMRIGLNRRSLFGFLAGMFGAGAVVPHSRRERERIELLDGKLPPTIWLNNALTKWSPHQRDCWPTARMHIEVAHPSLCTIVLTTPSKSGREPYRQYFLSVEQMVKNWSDPAWRKWHGLPKIDA
jgi:hypothetical protein